MAQRVEVLLEAHYARTALEPTPLAEMTIVINLSSLIEQSMTLGHSWHVQRSRQLPVLVTAETSLLELKGLVEVATGVPAVVQRLIFAGRMLADARTVDDYNLLSGTTVHLVIAEPAQTVALHDDISAEALKSLRDSMAGAGLRAVAREEAYVRAEEVTAAGEEQEGTEAELEEDNEEDLNAGMGQEEILQVAFALSQLPSQPDLELETEPEPDPDQDPEPQPQPRPRASVTLNEDPFYDSQPQVGVLQDDAAPAVTTADPGPPADAATPPPRDSETAPASAGLVCSGCDASLPRTAFSKSQAAKASTRRKCKQCVQSSLETRQLEGGSARIAPRHHATDPERPVDPAQPDPQGSRDEVTTNLPPVSAAALSLRQHPANANGTIDLWDLPMWYEGEHS